MDKSKFKKLAVMGMAGGLLLSAQSQVNATDIDAIETVVAHSSCGNGTCSGKKAPQDRHGDNSYSADSDRPVQYANGKKAMNEAELMSKLDSEGKRTYQSLDAEGKALALKLASQECKGKNDCAGLNACDTSENTCAGKGSCKGKSPSSFKDKNDAVKVASKKMAEKRAKSGGM